MCKFTLMLTFLHYKCFNEKQNLHLEFERENMLKKLLTVKTITAIIIILLLVLIFDSVKSEMIYTGVAENPSFMDVIKHSYHGLF